MNFAVLYHGCFRSCISCNVGRREHHPDCRSYDSTNREITEPKIEVSAYTILKSQELLCYLKERKIDLESALTYCQEITYSISSKKYQAIGFRNDQGGWEIRNRYFKGSSSPKGITHLKNGATSLLVFEGFF